MRAFPRRGRWVWLLSCVVAAGLAYRAVRLAAVFPMWGDEAFIAVNVMTRDVRGLLAPLDHGQVAPIGFLLVERAAACVLGSGETALRLAPFLAGVLAFLLFVRMALRRLSRTAAVAASAVLAMSYYPMRHGAEAKPYAFDLLAAAILVPLAWRVLDDPGRRAGWARFGAAAAIAVWFSYPAAFTAAGALLVLGISALRGRPPRSGASLAPRPLPRPVLAWAACAATVAASFVAMYVLVGRLQQWPAEAAESSAWGRHFPPLSHPWRIPAWLLGEVTGNLFAFPNGGPRFGSAATTFFVAAGAVALWMRGRRAEVCLLLSPLLPAFVAAAFRKYPFGGSARVALEMAVPICLLGARGFTSVAAAVLGGRRAVLVTRAATIVPILWCVGGAAADIARPHKNAADAVVRDALRGLAEGARPGDRWVVFGAFGPVPGVPDLYPCGGSAARLRYYLLRYAPPVLRWGSAPEALETSADGLIMVLVYHDEDVPFPEPLWDAYLRRLVARLGEPAERKVFRTGDGPEKIEVFGFPRR